MIAGTHRFALDLYARLRETPGNLFLSPFGVSTALAMASAGARGETDLQIAATLHAPADPPARHAGFAAAIARVNAEGGRHDPPDTLVTANALWLQEGDPFLPAFLETARTGYDAPPRQVDFAGDTEAARAAINAWVARQTFDKIRDLIGPADLSRDTSLALTNAVYFRGRWQSPFRRAATQAEQPFTTGEGATVSVAMMRQTGPFGYLDGGSFQAAELPYTSGGRSMVVILPGRADGLGALEARMGGGELGVWLRALAPRPVQIELPRFRVEAGFRLGETLAAMGMPAAFDAKRADFSGVNGRRDLFLSSVVHRAFVNVDEEGTEAAAATAVVMMGRDAVRAGEPVRFRADRPFLVLIRDRATGILLFLGRVTNPAG